MGAGRHLTHYPASIFAFNFNRFNSKNRHKKRAYMLLKRCKPFINLGRYIQTRTGDLYDVNVKYYKNIQLLKRNWRPNIALYFVTN